MGRHAAAEIYPQAMGTHHLTSVVWGDGAGDVLDGLEAAVLFLLRMC